MNAFQDDAASRQTNRGSSYFGAAAFAITWILSAWRVNPSGDWLGDYTTLRGMSGAAIGSQGILSAALTTLFRSVPFGTPTQRVALGAALAAACATWLAYELVLHALSSDQPATKSDRWLSLGSSLLVALSMPLQGIATSADGSTIAVACCLSAIWLFLGLSSQRPGASSPFAPSSRSRQAFMVGALLALTGIESFRIGLLALTIVSLLWVAQAGMASWRIGVIGFTVVICGLFLPWMFAKRGLLAAGLEHAAFEGLSMGLFRDVTQWLRIFYENIGPVWALAVGAGLAACIAQSDIRRHVWAVAAVALIPCLYVLDGGPRRGSNAALVVVAMVAFASIATRGMRALVYWATAQRTSAMRLGMTLVVLAQIVAILIRSEETAFANDRYRSLGSESWTDESLVELPARAIVLARDRRIVERLFAAQVAEAVRPDVLVVPLEHCTDPRVVPQLLDREPALTSLLRELAINGKPTENTLCSLADIRPLFVEFDGAWDTRLREHLQVQPLLHRVFSQTLGRSDRAAALAAGQRAVGRILKATADESPWPVPQRGERYIGNSITRQVLEQQWRAQLTILLALGDRASFEIVASDFGATFPQSDWLRALRARMRATQRGAIDAFDLLRRSEEQRSEPVVVPQGRPTG